MLYLPFSHSFGLLVAGLAIVAVGRFTYRLVLKRIWESHYAPHMTGAPAHAVVASGYVQDAYLWKAFKNPEIPKPPVWIKASTAWIGYGIAFIGSLGVLLELYAIAVRHS